jgi:hypothetical protein
MFTDTTSQLPLLILIFLILRLHHLLLLLLDWFIFSRFYPYTIRRIFRLPNKRKTWFRVRQAYNYTACSLDLPRNPSQAITKNLSSTSTCYIWLPHVIANPPCFFNLISSIRSLIVNMMVVQLVKKMLPCMESQISLEYPQVQEIKIFFALLWDPFYYYRPTCA